MVIRLSSIAAVAALAIASIAIFTGAPAGDASTASPGGSADVARHAAKPASRQVARPTIHRWFIPFPTSRKHEMAAYSKRHYGQHTWRLRHPKVIVEHVSQTDSARAVYNTFAPDIADPELHELPNVCAHFVISSSGDIDQLVHLNTRCRHTVGLNWTAIGIEHAGYQDSDILGNRRQMHASLRLTKYLRCHFKIKVRNVIGHAESLRSPFHHERVASLRHQTHGDFRHRSMRVYRHKLRQSGRC